MHVDMPVRTPGPTQNYADAPAAVWRPRPALAWTLRAVVVVGPGLVALAAGLAAVRWLPPARLGVDPWLWIAVEITAVTVLLLGLTRAARTLLPLATLLRLTTVFADRAPSRLRVAMRRHSPAALRSAGGAGVPTASSTHAAVLLDLVTALHAHDHGTRLHCERVQAYTTLVAQEMGLPAHEVARLGWAALLHDIGKLGVPAAVIAKPALPTEEEWALLATHPAAGMEIARPLALWLGPALDAIGQHHERWDGGGYPAGLAGTRISRAARVVAVADAFDTITSARPYKRALPAAEARAELARCAGEQFDPEVVRAFLRIGLVRLHRIAGPMSVLSALPGLQVLQAPLSSIAQGSATVATAVAAPAVAGAVAITLAVAGPGDASSPPVTPETGRAAASLVGTDEGPAGDAYGHGSEPVGATDADPSRDDAVLVVDTPTDAPEGTDLTSAVDGPGADDGDGDASVDTTTPTDAPTSTDPTPAQDPAQDPAQEPAADGGTRTDREADRTTPTTTTPTPTTPTVPTAPPPPASDRNEDDARDDADIEIDRETGTENSAR
ncbi:HD domain-containing protein [Actinotalea sp. AC32]|nr:HD domain-containing protein [Actinotalea sp. AC32]